MRWPSIGCSLLGHVFGITRPRLPGVPLQLGTEVIGMIGVANKQKGYGREDGRLLSTFANQSGVHLSENTVKSRIQEILEAGGTEPGSGGITSYEGTMGVIGAQRKIESPLPAQQPAAVIQDQSAVQPSAGRCGSLVPGSPAAIQ